MFEYLPIIVTALGLITSFSILLQTMKIMHLHESRDVALRMYIIFFINAVMWVLYGISIYDFPIMISYSVGSITTLSVIVAYFVYRKKGKFKKSPKSI